jgi:hypothetical protein
VQEWFSIQLKAKYSTRIRKPVEALIQCFEKQQDYLKNMSVKSYIFLDITPCSLFKVNQRFGGACRLHLRGREIIQARYQHEADVLISRKLILWSQQLLSVLHRFRCPISRHRPPIYTCPIDLQQ